MKFSHETSEFPLMITATAIGTATRSTPFAAGSSASSSATAISHSGAIDIEPEPERDPAYPGRCAIVVELNSSQAAALDQLAASEFLGSSADDVAEYLIIRGLDDLWRAGVLHLPAISK